MFSQRYSLAPFFILFFLPSNALGQRHTEILTRSLDQRSSIKSALFNVTVYRKKFDLGISEAKELEGGRFDYVFHWSPSNSRVDCREHRATGLEKERAFRYSILGRSLRVIDDENVDKIVKEFIGDSLDEANEFTLKRLRVDPRYMGFWPTTFEQMRKFDTNEITSLLRPLEGPMFEWDLHYNSETNSTQIKGFDPQSKLSWEFEIDNIRFVPNRIKLAGFSGEGVTDEISTEWQSVDGCAFPLNVKFQQSKGSTVQIAEEWSFSQIKLNVPIERTLHSWESLGIAEDTVLMQTSPSGVLYFQWKNGRFGQWVPEPLVNKFEEGRIPTRLFPLSLGVLLIFAGGLLAKRFWSQSKLQNRF